MMKRVIFLSVFLLSAPACAQVEDNVSGIFYDSCGVAGGKNVTMELSNHLRITVYGNVKPDEAYRTKGEVFEGEKPSMEVSLCPVEKEQCQSVEGILSTYKSDGETIEAAIEYFDGTETQGDAESIQGHTSYFTVKKDKAKDAAICR